VDSLHTIAKLAGTIREAFKNSQLSQTCSMRQQLETANMLSAIIAVVNPRDDQKKADCIRLAMETIILGRANEQDKGAISTMMTTLDGKLDPSRPIDLF